MSTTQQAPPSQDAFSEYFASPTHYGERWHKTLDPALKRQQNKAIFYNRYTSLEDFNRNIGSPDSIERVHFPSAANDIQADNLLCFSWKESIPPPEKISTGLKPYGYIPTALALAVHLLQVLPGDRVLEHGSSGASLAMAQSIWPHLQPSSTTPPLAGAKKGVLHANWFDSGSSGSIATGFKDHLPASLGPTGTGEAMIIGPGIELGEDELTIEKPPFGAGGYDKVFIKPFSCGEAAVLSRRNSPGSAASQPVAWPPAEAPMIIHTIGSLLVSALGAVRVGGRVMYVTSSIAKEENDAVIEGAIATAAEAAAQGACEWTAEIVGFGDEVERMIEEGWAERTEKGWIVLPDHPGGRNEGPLYFCMLTKNRV